MVLITVMHTDMDGNEHANGSYHFVADGNPWAHWQVFTSEVGVTWDNALIAEQLMSSTAINRSLVVY